KSKYSGPIFPGKEWPRHLRRWLNCHRGDLRTERPTPMPSNPTSVLLLMEKMAPWFEAIG
ncbi:MAG: hypothetical protein ACRCU2_30345, partial [Planktothrix sp.]